MRNKGKKAVFGGGKRVLRPDFEGIREECGGPEASAEERAETREKTRKKTRDCPSPWSEDLYVKAFRLAQSGLRTDTELAGALGVGVTTLKKWKEKRPAFRRAIEEAGVTEKGEKEGTFLDYVYNRLPKDLRRLWEDIVECGELGDYERVEGVLKGHGTHKRMNLFIHALVHCNFNGSEASRMVNLSPTQLTEWRRRPEFRRLLQQIDWHKKNFFEGALVRLVKDGDPHATVFANKTLNRDRGYNDKQEIDLKSTVEHRVRLDELPLTIEQRKALLEAIRKSKEPAGLIGHTPAGVTDAEFEVKKEPARG